MQAQGELKKWVQRIIRQLLRLFPNDDHINQSKWRRLLPHAQCALSHSQNDDDGGRVDLAWNCVMALCSELDVQVMQIRKRVLGDEHPDTWTTMANLATTYWNQGRWAEAEELEV
jgi:hypothetical protein